MRVKNVYQNASGQWHIEYGLGNLMTLAVRVYCGQILIAIWIAMFIGLPLIVLTTLASGKSLHEEKSISSPFNCNIPQESIDRELSN